MGLVTFAANIKPPDATLFEQAAMVIIVAGFAYITAGTLGPGVGTAAGLTTTNAVGATVLHVGCGGSIRNCQLPMHAWPPRESEKHAHRGDGAQHGRGSHRIWRRCTECRLHANRRRDQQERNQGVQHPDRASSITQCQEFGQYLRGGTVQHRWVVERGGEIAEHRHEVHERRRQREHDHDPEAFAALEGDGPPRDGEHDLDRHEGAQLQMQSAQHHAHAPAA